MSEDPGLGRQRVLAAFSPEDLNDASRRLSFGFFKASAQAAATETVQIKRIDRVVFFSGVPEGECCE
jgi:hypothetical protein